MNIEQVLRQHKRMLSGTAVMILISAGLGVYELQANIGNNDAYAYGGAGGPCQKCEKSTSNADSCDVATSADEETEGFPCAPEGATVRSCPGTAGVVVKAGGNADKKPTTSSANCAKATVGYICQNSAKLNESRNLVWVKATPDCGKRKLCDEQANETPCAPPKPPPTSAE
jgi:hypothetical protein